MERRNERVDLEALKDRVAKLENELDMAYRRIKALLTENKELKDGQQKIFDSFVMEPLKFTAKKKVAGWRQVNPEGLEELQNPKKVPSLEKVSPQILKMVRKEGKTETWTPKRLRKFADILEKSPAQHRRE